MTRLALVIAVLASLVGASSAQASAPIRECGTWNGSYWTYKSGGRGFALSLTTRNVDCYTARRFSLRYRGTDTYYPTWKCRESSEYESSEVRCTASRGRVIHWYSGV